MRRKVLCRLAIDLPQLESLEESLKFLLQTEYDEPGLEPSFPGLSPRKAWIYPGVILAQRKTSARLPVPYLDYRQLFIKITGGSPDGKAIVNLPVDR
jgi:hypothetical protein